MHVNTGWHYLAKRTVKIANGMMNFHGYVSMGIVHTKLILQIMNNHAINGKKTQEQLTKSIQGFQNYY